MSGHMCLTVGLQVCIQWVIPNFYPHILSQGTICNTFIHKSAYQHISSYQVLQPPNFHNAPVPGQLLCQHQNQAIHTSKMHTQLKYNAMQVLCMRILCGNITTDWCNHIENAFCWRAVSKSHARWGNLPGKWGQAGPKCTTNEVNTWHCRSHLSQKEDGLHH